MKSSHFDLYYLYSNTKLITVAIIDGVYDEREKEFVEYLRKMLHMPKEVGEQALALVQKLIDASVSIENFVAW